MSDVSQLASRLREPITIQSVALTSDGVGGSTESWSNIVTCFAEVEALSGGSREQVIAAQREARAAYRITIRQRDGITTAMRILWGGLTLHIHGVVQHRAITEMIAYNGGEA